jgi:hypothetical protein
MECKDLNGKQISVGDEVVVSVDAYLATGTVKKFCGTTLNIWVTHCTGYPYFVGDRYVRYDLTEKKVVVLDKVKEKEVKNECAEERFLL